MVVVEEIDPSPKSSPSYVAPSIRVPSCSPPEGVVRCTVLLSEEERLRLESDRTNASDVVGLGTTALGWDVYYDNLELAVTLRGWWLLSRGGGWMLRVPEFVPVENGSPGAMRISGFKEIVEIEEILTTLGLMQHAEAYRSGVVHSVERLFAQAGVLPFARLRADRRAFRVEEMTVSIDSVRFDATFAEAVAVARTLFELGDRARSETSACFVQLELAAPEFQGCDAAMQKVQTFLQKHEVNNQGMSGPSVCPMLLEYLKRWRPTHLRAIRRVGAVPQENGELKHILIDGTGASSSGPPPKE